MKPKMRTVRTAAAEIGTPYSTARAHCLKLGIGEIYGTVKLLTPEEFRQLAAFKPKRGRPTE